MMGVLARLSKSDGVIKLMAMCVNPPAGTPVLHGFRRSLQPSHYQRISREATPFISAESSTKEFV